jgi:hypothetical protein
MEKTKTSVKHAKLVNTYCKYLYTLYWLFNILYANMAEMVPFQNYFVELHPPRGGATKGPKG